MRKKRGFSKAILAAGASLALGTAASGDEGASEARGSAPRETQVAMVVRNARIFTSNAARPWSQALAIRDGKIVAIGSDNSVAALIGPQTRVIDAGQRLIIPGIIDAHMHLAYAVKDTKGINCEFAPDANLDQLLAAVEQCAAKRKPGEWIVGKAWGSSLIPTLSSAEALRRLDRATPNNPVILRNDSIHDRWVNSAALKLARITRDTRDPPQGRIGRDLKTGELNGLLIEPTASDLVDSISPLGGFFTTESLEPMVQGIKTVNALGVTGWNDALVTAETADGYARIDAAGDLHARVALSIHVDPAKMAPESLPALFQQVSRADSAHLSTKFAKIFLDGTPVSRTASVIAPYLPDAEHGADYHGTPFATQAQVDAAVIKLDAMGVSVKLHATGDGSVRQALNAIEAARKANGDKGPWHTVAHAGHVAPEDIGRFARLRAIIDASPTLWYPGSIMNAIIATLGKERGERFFLFRTDLRAGAIIAGGSDWKTLPAEYSDLWAGIEGMVTRRNPTGTPKGALHPEEALDLGEVLRLYTINSAMAIDVDRVAGSLEVGKSADFAMLNQDIFKRGPECISRTASVLTVFEGEIVSQSPDMREPTCD